MTTTLPSELIFHIITFLQDDKTALSACSLSCSALAAASKPLLFHTIRTNLEPRATDRFESLSESGPAVLSLIKKIDMTNPTLHPEANRRTMTALTRIMAHQQMQDSTPELKLVMRPLHRSLFRFGPSFVPCLDSARPWVTSLELDRVDLRGDMHFWPVVLAFPNLITLILGYVSVPLEMVHISPQQASGVSDLILKKSALDGDHNVGWFLVRHHLPFPSLISLDVRFSTMPDKGFSRLGEQYGATVRSLRFGAVISRDLMTNSDKLGSTAEFISRFGNLEELTIQGLFLPSLPIQQSHVTFEWIPITLGGVPATVRKITIEVVATHISCLDVIPWLAIDVVLAHQLQSVSIVEILLATPVGMARLLENVGQEMGERLPLASQRGVLRCCAVAEHPV